MNVLKNFELIFVAAASLAVVTSYATASTPVLEVPAVAVAAVAAAPANNMAVIVVAAKRLTAAEKAALI